MEDLMIDDVMKKMKYHQSPKKDAKKVHTGRSSPRRKVIPHQLPVHGGR